MTGLLKRAYDPYENKYMYMMLIVSMGVFFAFIGLASNKQINSIISEVEPMFMVWLFALVFILAIFSFVFYHFICIYMLEEKMRDYAVLNSLGVSAKNISLSFQLALGKSILVALLIGLFGGGILYYAILLVLQRIMTVSFFDIPFLAVAVFSVVYLIIYLTNGFILDKKIVHLGITEMLYYKKQDKSLKRPVACQLVGFSLLLLGLLILTWNKLGGSYGALSALLPMLCLSSSAYLLTLSFSYWYTKLFARSKQKYQRNLFYISQLRTNYKKYAKLLTACTLIILFGLYMLILDLAIMTSADNTTEEHPFDYVVDFPLITPEEIVDVSAFETANSTAIQTAQLIEIGDATIQWDSEEYTDLVRIMPEKSYLQLTGVPLSLKGDDMIVLSQINREFYNVRTSIDENGVEWGFRPLGSTTFQIDKTVCTGNIVKEIWEIAYNIENRGLRTFILSNTYYEDIVRNKNLSGAKYLLNVKEDSDNTVIYGQLSHISPNVQSRALNIERQEQGKFFMFILILIAVLMLFFSLVCLMLLRIQQNVHNERQKFENLYAIGYTTKQLISEVRKEMATLFFIPVGIGTSLSVLYVIFSNESINSHLVLVALTVSVLFFLTELCFFHLTSKVLVGKYNLIVRR